MVRVLSLVFRTVVPRGELQPLFCAALTLLRIFDRKNSYRPQSKDSCNSF